MSKRKLDCRRIFGVAVPLVCIAVAMLLLLCAGTHAAGGDGPAGECSVTVSAR